MLFLVVPLTWPAPPPGFMHMRRVRRINKPDHGMIDVHREFERMHNLRRALADIRHFRRRNVSTIAVTEPDPDHALAFANRKTGDRDFTEIDGIIFYKRRDGCAASVPVEFPAVVTAFDLVAADPPGRQRRTAMRTIIAQRKNLSGRRPAKYDRLAADFPVHKPAHGNIARGDAEIPDITKHQRRRGQNRD